jgi:vesicular inhibitory amino acid transporter
VIGFLFVLELTAACVALFILFADSLDLLIQGYGVTAFKVLFGVLTFPLSFVPLRYLGYSSTLGIISCLSIVLLVILDGLIKPDAPGSLLSPEKTYLFPKYWSTLPLSFGLLMSPWGGHSVFPNIYRDMRHPARYGESLRYTFGFTYILDVGIAIAGLLMFGEHTRDIITSNLLMTEGYPKFVSVLIQICITVIPLTKIPLNARPIFSTFEHLCGLGPRQIPDVPGLIGSSGLKRGFLKCGIRLATTIIVMVIAIVCPSFDRVMALMGSAFCFTVCIILPLAFYLKLFGKEIGRWERIFNWFLIVSCSCMAIMGTVWAFLPRSITHAR